VSKEYLTDHSSLGPSQSFCNLYPYTGVITAPNTHLTGSETASSYAYHLWLGSPQPSYQYTQTRQLFELYLCNFVHAMDGVQSQQHDEFVTPQWVEIGSLHQQQHGQPVHHHHHPDYSTYGFVEQGMQSGMNNQNQFRLQASPAVAGTNYLSITQWGGVIPATTAAPASYIPSAPTAQPPPPSLPPAQVASATLSASQPVNSHAPNPSPRRTLTDADRRRMCLFHEENPNVKQTEIGGTRYLYPFVAA